MTLHSDGTATNIRMHIIFLENRFIGLHLAADNIGLSSLNFFSGGLLIYFFEGGGANDGDV